MDLRRRINLFDGQHLDATRLCRINRGQIPVAIFIISLLAIPSLSIAAPTITSASGTFANGTSITVSGSNFGIGPNVVFFTDFEQGSAGETILTGTAGAEVGAINLVAGTAAYTDSTSISGQNSFQTPMNDKWGAVQVVLPDNVTDIYVSYWTYMPAGDQWPGEGDNPDEAINWKIVWVLGKDINGNPSTAIDDKVIPTVLGYDTGTNISYMVTGNSQDPAYSKYVNLEFTKGQWIRFSCWIKGDPTYGAMRFWQTNPLGTILKTDVTGIATLRDGGSRKFVNINGYGRITSSSHPTFDDVYIATGPQAQARIEIGNASTYTSCTKLTVATPTQWSIGQITATLWGGWLSNSNEQPYLYIIDAAGNVSTGYKISMPPKISSIKVE